VLRAKPRDQLGGLFGASRMRRHHQYASKRQRTRNLIPHQSRPALRGRSRSRRFASSPRHHAIVKLKVAPTSHSQNEGCAAQHEQSGMLRMQ
jgi:hypothetical protein